MYIETDYAVSQFLHKRFIPRPGVDRVGRRFSIADMPVDDAGRPDVELARQAQSLFVDRLASKASNPCDDIYEVEVGGGQRCKVRMQWLRLYWREVGA